MDDVEEVSGRLPDEFHWSSSRRWAAAARQSMRMQDAVDGALEV